VSQLVTRWYCTKERIRFDSPSDQHWPLWQVSPRFSGRERTATMELRAIRFPPRAPSP
ncbi:MAG: hypothetical protein ACI8UR_001309, partial [Natronomonas sp.]